MGEGLDPGITADEAKAFDRDRENRDRLTEEELEQTKERVKVLRDDYLSYSGRVPEFVRANLYGRDFDQGYEFDNLEVMSRIKPAGEKIGDIEAIDQEAYDAEKAESLKREITYRKEEEEGLWEDRKNISSGNKSYVNAMDIGIVVGIRENAEQQLEQLTSAKPEVKCQQEIDQLQDDFSSLVYKIQEVIRRKGEETPEETAERQKTYEQQVHQARRIVAQIDRLRAEAGMTPEKLDRAA